MDYVNASSDRRHDNLVPKYNNQTKGDTMKGIIYFLLILVVLMMLGFISPDKVQNVVVALFSGIFSTFKGVINAFL